MNCLRNCDEINAQNFVSNVFLLFKFLFVSFQTCAMNNSTANITTIGRQEGDVQKAALYLSIALIVIFINAMTMLSYFLRKKSKRTIPDVFILSLSLSAIMTMITVIFILAFVRATGNEYFDGLMGACYVQVFFGTQLRLTDVSITTGITIDRFMALYKPLLYRVRIKLINGKIACLVMWTVSGIVAVLPLVGFGSISKRMESFCTANWTSEISYVVLSIAYVQFAVVLLCYIGIFRAISGLVNRQKEMSRSQTLSYSTVKHPPRNKLQKMNAIDCDDVFGDGNNGDNLSYTNPVFLQDDIAKTVRELSEENIKSVLETVQEGEEFELKTKVRIKSIEKRKVSNVTQYFSSTSEATVDVSVRVNNDQRRGYPEVHTKSKDTENKEEISLRRTAIERTHPQTRHELIRAQSCPTAPIPNKRGKPEKAFSESSEYGKVPLGNIGRLKSLSVIVRDKFKESRRKKNASTSSMKNFWAENQRFAKVMGVVVFLFYASWLPLAVRIYGRLRSSTKTRESATTLDSRIAS